MAVFSRLDPPAIFHDEQVHGLDAMAFSIAAVNAGSSGLVRLEKLPITLPRRSTTYL
ncbi:hypothetical protein D3C72_2418770 [compost metagenome]